LAAFLRDGSGYKKSGFRVKSNNKSIIDRPDDPLPWLKLPRLDFVEVAGQQAVPVAEEEGLEQLEQLRLRMNRELQEENIVEATRLRNELERLMKDRGIQFTTDGHPR
jgi:hypothetical protein